MTVFTIGKDSGWKWVTSGGGGASYTTAKIGGDQGFAGVGPTLGGGYIRIKSPYGHEERFEYHYLGVGASLGIPKVSPKLPDFGFAGSIGSMFSDGHVYLNANLGSYTLSADDFTGLCAIEDASLSNIYGRGITAVYFGIPLQSLPKTVLELTSNWRRLASWIGDNALGLASLPRSGPKAVLISESESIGLQLGGSTGFSIGWVDRATPDWVKYWLLQFETPAIPPDAISLLSREDPTMKVQGAEKAGAVIRILGDVLFSFSKPVFKTEDKDATGPEILAARAALTRIGAILNERQNSLRRIAIWGHTDTIRFELRRRPPGVPNNNQELSELRARRMRNWIVTQNLAPASKVLAYGAAEREPVAPNTTARGRQRNRRLDIYLFED